MATMRKEILVYEKDRNVLKFLHSFFKENKDYSVHFVDKKDALKETIMEEKPDAVLPELDDDLLPFALPDKAERVPLEGKGAPP